MYPTPLISQTLDALGGKKYFTSLDLAKGYYQVPLDDTSIPLTAFRCHLGLYEYVRLPMGLKNACAIFQRTMERILDDYMRKFALVYIDDIIVYSDTLEQHLQHLDISGSHYLR